MYCIVISVAQNCLRQIALARLWEDVPEWKFKLYYFTRETLTGN